MSRFKTRITRIAFPLIALLSAQISPAGADENWPQFRGSNSTGVIDGSAELPDTWSETENVRWKIAIPGLGHSTPIVWDDRVFASVTSFSSPFELMKGASEDAQPSTASILWLAG